MRIGYLGCNSFLLCYATIFGWLLPFALTLDTVVPMRVDHGINFDAHGEVVLYSRYPPKMPPKSW